MKHLKLVLYACNRSDYGTAVIVRKCLSLMCCFNTQAVRDDVVQKQDTDVAIAFLHALEGTIKITPKAFTSILDVLEGLAIPRELVAQMREQCGAREVTGTQKPPAQSAHLEIREAKATHGPTTPPVHHETREATATRGPSVPPIHHETSGATATHGPLTPPIHPGMCTYVWVFI